MDLVRRIAVGPQEPEAGEHPLGVVVHLVVVVGASVDDGVLAELASVGDQARPVYPLEAHKVSRGALRLVVARDVQAADLLVEIDELLR